MNEILRKSLPTKISAIGLSLVILFGNFWLVDVVFATEPASWKVYGFVAGCLVAAIGAVSLLALLLKQFLATWRKP